MTTFRPVSRLNVLVGECDDHTKNFSFLMGDRELPEGFEHWIIKFTPKEYPWRGER